MMLRKSGCGVVKAAGLYRLSKQISMGYDIRYSSGCTRSSTLHQVDDSLTITLKFLITISPQGQVKSISSCFILFVLVNPGYLRL
jgi:hypothetical protein